MDYRRKTIQTKVQQLFLKVKTSSMNYEHINVSCYIGIA
jgi:hypothetical protein